MKFTNVFSYFKKHEIYSNDNKREYIKFWIVVAIKQFGYETIDDYYSSW